MVASLAPWTVLLLLALSNCGHCIIKDIKLTMEVVEQLKEMIYEATGDSGSVTVQGRVLHYKVKGGFYKWKYQYKGEAWDEETKITVKTNGWKSAGGAREHALEDLVKKLVEMGYLTN